MIKSLNIKRVILRKVLNILGLYSVGLIAACAKYGTESTVYLLNLKGTVKSNDSLKPIENIQLKVINCLSASSANTDENGEFSANARIETNQIILNISDTDGDVNGSFISIDTLFYLSSNEIKSGNKSDIEILLEKVE